MDNLFLLLFLASFVCLIIGLVKPTVFSRFIKGEITRKKIGLIFGIATVAFFVMFGITTDTSKQTQSNTNGKVAEQKTEQKQLSTEEQAKKDADEALAKKQADEAKVKQEAEAKAQKEAEEAAKIKAEEENKIKEAEEAKIKEAEEIKRQKEEELAKANEEKDFKVSCTSISYNKLEKDPSSYIGEPVYYRGKIEQAGSKLFSEWFRISVTSIGYGYYSDTIWVNYPETTDFAEDDVVRFWGTVIAPHCYKSQAGWDICIPAVDAKYLSK